MPKLMLGILSGKADGQIGGRPAGIATTNRPHCASCSGPMQFLATIPLRLAEIPEFEATSKALLLFQCQNDPGMCDEWDPNSGGNCALMVGATEVELEVPPGETVLPSSSGFVLRPYTLTAGEDAAYAKSLTEPGSRVLGKLGGEPTWIQGDETPTCDCGAVMRFAAQLEDCGGQINFGDAGAGYAFACAACKQKGKFLWQCS